MNILEELKFFTDNNEIGIGFPILLTTLNLPSILFEIFPFIILISTQFFFIKFQYNDEILIFKNNGINNLKLISYLCLLVFFLGIIIISIFHVISSNMKNNYLEFKNKYTKDNKYLAVVNENGLWIKDKLDNKYMIIHSGQIEKNILKNLVISIYDDEFRNQSNIIANEANITQKTWSIDNAILVDNFGKIEKTEKILFKTNFDYIKINSLFSNLESLSIFELYKQRKDFESVGLNTLEVDIYLNKIFSIPISLIIFALLSSILMLNIKLKKSKSFIIILGILLSVSIYYIYYFFGLLGANNKIPILLAIWLPNLILFLSCMIGIVNINEK
tara:strand:- start:29463 stop:30455 length:993 start_codon:yes stop_codon:yes gene_type:complete